MKTLLIIIFLTAGTISQAQEIDQAIQRRIDASIQASPQKQVSLDTGESVLPVRITRMTNTLYRLSLDTATSTTAGGYTPYQRLITEQQLQLLKQEEVLDKARISLLEAKITELANKLAGLKATTTIQ